MKRRMMALLHRVHAPVEGRERIFSIIKSKYGEQHRVYHTLAHIRHCLEEFGRVRKTLNNPDAVELALWFHDIVCVPLRPDNEERSVKLAEEVLWSSGISDKLIEQVGPLILATRHNVPLPPNNADAIMIADIDLSPLGVPADHFDDNSRRIRRELKMGDNKKSFEAQARFLLKLLERRQGIYRSDFFYDKYGAQARNNIERLAVRAGVM